MCFIKFYVLVNYLYRKLVQFGVMKGLLRRMHKYPVALPGEHISPRVQHFVRLLDGKHSFDQICCETGRHLMCVCVSVKETGCICWALIDCFFFVPLCSCELEALGNKNHNEDLGIKQRCHVCWGRWFSSLYGREPKVF